LIILIYQMRKLENENKILDIEWIVMTKVIDILVMFVSVEIRKKKNN
jgi:hypothetical protein